MEAQIHTVPSELMEALKIASIELSFISRNLVKTSDCSIEVKDYDEFETVCIRTNGVAITLFS